MTEPTRPLLLFGGSFDPPHKGHLGIAEAVAQCFPNAVLHLIPTARAWQKGEAWASSSQRVAMLQRLFADFHHPFVIDRIELAAYVAGQASYSFNTLTKMRRHYGATRPFIWVLGSDQWAQLDTWYHYEDLFWLCHFCVLKRDPLRTATWPLAPERLTTNPQDLLTAPAGRVFFLDAALQPERSTTIRNNPTAATEMLPATIAAYIATERLYTSINHP